MLAGKLLRGELVAVPSETVYGLAANGLDPTACAKIFEAKDRPPDDPLILHLHNIQQIDEICEWSAEAQSLAEAFWPGPLTLILPKKKCVPDIVTSGRPSVAVRMPKHPVFRSLLTLVNQPLAAPSANPFGYISPTTAKHVFNGLSGRISSILDGGNCDIGLESTILDLRNPNKPNLLRPGAIGRDHIGQILNTKINNLVTEPTEANLSPGLQLRHYSPKKPLILLDRIPSELKTDEFLIVYSQIPSSYAGRANVIALSPKGDGETAARQLFATLRNADHSSYRRILIELPPLDVASSEAIHDRLRRAAARTQL